MPTSKGVILRILRLVYCKYRYRVAAGYVCVVGAVLSSLAIPYLLGSSINQMLEPGATGTSQVYMLALILLLAGIARGLFALGQSYFGEIISQRLAYELRNAYFEKLLRLSPTFYDKHTTGALMARATSDIEGIRLFVSMGAIRFGFIFVMITGAAVAMFLADTKLALVSLAFVPLLGWQALASSRRLRSTWMHIQARTGQASTVLQESIAGNRVVKTFGAEKFEAEKFRACSRQIARASLEAEKAWASSFSYIGFGLMASFAAILWVGGQEVVSGRTTLNGQAIYAGLTPGELTAFLFYMGLLAMPVKMMGWMVNSFARASSCGQRLFEVLDARPSVEERPGAISLGRTLGRVAFENVSFSYDGSYRGRGWALKDVNLDVQPGQTVALLGQPGSGKTSVAHLLLRFYDVAAGRISLDGIDLRDITIASLRQKVGVVQQDVFLHGISIRDNVAFGSPRASLDEVVGAVKMAQLHDFVISLPNGYDTIVGERGVMLSGGQRQRLAIARTLLRDPAVLILDDSTSSVDAHTDRLLHSALQDAAKGRTTFIITHRLSSTFNADLFLVFRDGVIIERGSHEELLALGGEYYLLYHSQLQSREAGIFL